MGRKSKYEERQGSLFPLKETNREEKKYITSHNLVLSAHAENSSSISQGIQNNTDPIILYPSNWLYNASVIGFLRVIAYGKGESYVERNMLMDDGRVKVSVNDLFLKQYSIEKYRIPVSLKYFIDFIVSFIWRNKYNDEKKDIESKYKEVVNKWYDNKVLMEEQKDFAIRYIFVGNKLFSSNCPYQNLISKKRMARV